MWVTTVLKCLFSINCITAPSCTVTPNSNLLYKAGSTTPWTQYSFSHTAATAAPTLVFGFSNGGADYNYLDDVSVVDTSAPSIQLLQNPSFENSTSTLTGWVTWCASACGSGSQGQVTTTGCYSGNCYVDHCQNNYDYLAQSFSATIGHTYTISFWLYQVPAPGARFYADIEDWRIISQLQRRERQTKNTLTIKDHFIPLFLFDLHDELI
jgi:hypothetical protein